MNKRLLSIVCAIAIVFSMVGVGAALVLKPASALDNLQPIDNNSSLINDGGDGDSGSTKPVLVGTGVKFDSTTAIVESDWTAKGDVKVSDDKSYVSVATHDSRNNIVTYAYNQTFNLTGGFTATYKATAKYSTSNYSSGYVMGVKIGNVVVALKEYCLPTILIDDTVVATGDVIGTTESNYNSSTNSIVWMSYRNYLNNNQDKTVYKVAYDPATKVITFGAYIDGEAVARIATYTDTEGKIDVDDAAFALYTNDQWDQYNNYKDVELVGKASSDDDDDNNGGNTGDGDDNNNDDNDDNDDNQEPQPLVPLSGVGIEFGNGVNIDPTKWNANGIVTIADDMSFVELATGDTADVVTFAYNNKFDLTNGFTVNYKAGLRRYTGNYTDEYVMGLKIGNVILALKEYATPTILVDNAEVATGNPVGATATNFDASTGKIIWTEYAAFVATSDIEYRVVYDVTTKTLTFGGYVDGELSGSLATYYNVEDKLNFSEAEFALYTTDRWDQFTPYTALKLVGTEVSNDDNNDNGEGEGEGDNSGDDNSDENNQQPEIDITANAVVGLAVKFDKDNLVVEEDWIGKGGSTVSGDKTTVKLASADTNREATFSYVKTFNFTKGFTLTYNADCKQYTGNYSTGYVMGAKIGNITVALKEYATPVILIDGEVVATGGVIAKNESNFNADTNSIIWSNYVAYLHSSAGKSTEYKVVYDPATKTLTFGAYIEGKPVAAIASYEDVDGKIDIADAVFALYTTDCWDQYNNYSNVALYGYIEPAAAPEEVVGEELKSTWAPEKMTEEDWDGKTQYLQNNEFSAPNDNAKHTIETKKSYNLSNGFSFKGTLVFKNSFTNYYGEWCSAIFGDALNNLELRIRNDSHDGEKDDKTYTAYLLSNGEQLASYDLTLMPNGEYQVKYSNGKVVVSLGGSEIVWTLADGSKSAAVTYDGSVLKNAKVTLSLTNNWCPNGRKWSNISLSPLSSNGVATGDGRNLVLPIVVMVVAVVAAVALLILKKKQK